MSAAVLDAPPAPVVAEPSDDAIVRAYRIDRSFWEVEPDELPAGKTLEDLEKLDHGPAYYAEKNAAQVWSHVDRWAREIPGCDVMVALVEISWAEWRDAMLGTPDEVSGS